MRSKVAILECPDYSPDQARRAVRDVLDRLGGLGRFVREGQSVCVKINHLGEHRMESAVNTHPALVAALAARGGTVTPPRISIGCFRMTFAECINISETLKLSRCLRCHS